MNNLILHPDSRQKLELLVHDQPQSLLLTAERGVGLLTIARAVAGKELAGEIHPMTASGQSDRDAGTITVEIIRKLYEQTRSRRKTRQIIIIDNADLMSNGAQGAFLKLLEEPLPHVQFILTTHQPEKLLLTIRSRVQLLWIRPATHQQTINYIESLGVADKARIQLLFLADGLPAEINRLIEDEEYFSQRAMIMADARQLLTADSYQKLLVLQPYFSNRATAMQLIDSLLLVARRSTSAKPQPGLVKQLDKLLDIQEKLAANHNIRLQLTRIVL